MSARAAIANLISNDSQIGMLGFTVTDVYAANAVDSPDRTRNFIVIRWEDVPRTFPGGGPDVVSIWVHCPKEKSRDYGVIDATIARLRELLGAAEHVSGSDGWALSAANYDGASGDLFDDGYNTLTRWVRFRCACREIS